MNYDFCSAKTLTVFAAALTMIIAWLGVYLSNILKINIQNLVGNKKLMLVLVLVFGAFGFFLFNAARVKGVTSPAYGVVVWDDNNRILVKSASLETGKVLEVAGIKTWPEDLVTTELISDPVADGGAGQKIVIKRAPTYTVTVDDGTRVVRSWGKTVGEVLANQVNLGPKDIVEPATGTAAIPGEITITRINVVDTEETEVVPFSTTFKDDYFTPKGQQSVITPGQNGSKLKQLKITFRNGVEVSRVVIGSTLTASSRAQLVKRGVMPTYDPYGRWPLLVTIGTRYGVSPVEMFSVMMCESKGYQYAGEDTAHQGIFQWDGSFYGWAEKAGLPGANIFDVTAQASATAFRVSKYGWIAWSCKP